MKRTWHPSRVKKKKETRFQIQNVYKKKTKGSKKQKKKGRKKLSV